MDATQNGPILLPVESGVVRPVQILWAERLPAGIGFTAAALMIITALYGEWSALQGLFLVAAWHGFWVQAGRRDPQYGAVMWRAWWESPLPEQLEACPDIGAPRVKREASVPVRGEEGAHVMSGAKALTQQAPAPLNAPAMAPGTTSVQVNSSIGIGDVAVVYGTYKLGESTGHSQYAEELTRRFPVPPQSEYYRSVIPPHSQENFHHGHTGDHTVSDTGSDD